MRWMIVVGVVICMLIVISALWISGGDDSE